MSLIQIAVTRARGGVHIQYAEDVITLKPLGDGEGLDRIAIMADGLLVLNIPMGMVADSSLAKGIIVPLPEYPE